MKGTQMKIRKVLSLGAAAVVVAATLSSCASTAEENTSDGPVKLDFWYSSSGAAATTLKTLVDQFNADNADSVTINAIYQGTYDESMSKLTNSVQSGGLPALIQGGDTFSTYLRDTGLTTPPGEVKDLKGETFSGDDLVPLAKNYYTFDGTLSSIPIMVSQPVVVYNKDLLSKAGIDPSAAPESMSDLIDLSSKAYASTGVAGLTMFINPWWSEQFTASEGLEYCTPENGVGSNPADAFKLASDKQVSLWKGVQDLVNSGAMLNTGTDGSASANAFIAGQAAFMLQSSQIYGDVKANAPFEFGVWPLPAGSDKGGAVPGGNSIWLIKEGKSEREMAAAASFASFMGSSDVQEQIFTETGYLPTSSKTV